MTMTSFAIAHYGQCLGSWISDDGYPTKDIQARIAMGKTLFVDKKMLTGIQIQI